MLLRDLIDQLVSITYCTVAIDKSVVTTNFTPAGRYFSSQKLAEGYVCVRAIFNSPPRIAGSLLHLLSVSGDFTVR